MRHYVLMWMSVLNRRYRLGYGLEIVSSGLWMIWVHIIGPSVRDRELLEVATLQLVSTALLYICY